MGVRTVFNILGPLSNPAEPAFHVIGAYHVATAELMAQALMGMSIQRAFVIHGAEGWDEPTPIGPFELFDVTPGNVRRERRSPADFGLPVCRPESLGGGDAQYNARALRAVLRCEDRGPHRDALLLGAALALEVAGVARNGHEGIARATATIEDGSAGLLLDRLIAFSAASVGGARG
jgi:anthranilate phosphoribosyltransferase